MKHKKKVRRNKLHTFTSLEGYEHYLRLDWGVLTRQNNIEDGKS